MEPRASGSKNKDKEKLIPVEEFKRLGSQDSLLRESPSLHKIYEEAADKLKAYRPLTPTKYREREKKQPSTKNIDAGPVAEPKPERRKSEKTPFKNVEETEPQKQSAESEPEKAEEMRPPTAEESHPTVDDTSREEAVRLTDTRFPSEGPGEPAEVSVLPQQQPPPGTPKQPVKTVKKRRRRRFAIWNTSEMFVNTDRQTFIYLSIQEFIIYLIFLTSVSIVAIGSLSIVMYYYSFVLSDVFTRTNFRTAEGLNLNFREIKTIQQYWGFLKQTLIDTLFFKYLEDKLTSKTLTMQEEKLVLLENIMIGSPRIRQVRVKPNSCKIPKNFDGIFRSCFGYFKSNTEDKGSYGWKKGSEWTYSENLAQTYNGKISTYGTGGFYLNLTRNYVTSKYLIQTLYDNLWIDHGTRAVFVDFTVYTPNVNLFCVVKLVAEFPPSGGVITSSNFNTLKLIRYVSSWDHIILGFEIISIVILILYTTEEVREIIVLQWRYIQNPWNIVDLVIVVLGWNLFTIGYIRYTKISQEMPALISTIDTDDHGNFDSLADIQKLFNTASAFFAALVWVKLLKFMMLVKVVFHILKTIEKCCQEIIGLTFIFMVLIMSFALLGHLLFGSQVEEFGTIGQAIISLVVLIVGSLNHKKVEEVRPFLGPLYFILFIYLVILIFLCLFVAVIVNGFSTVRFDIIEDTGRLYLKELIYNLVQNFLKFTQLKKMRQKFIEKIRMDEANDRYQSIVEMLRRSGFRGQELNLFLIKHRVQKGQTITQDKMQEIYDDIDGKEQLYREALEHEEIANEVELLRLKLAYSDKMIEELASKVELLLKKHEKK